MKIGLATFVSVVLSLTLIFTSQALELRGYKGAFFLTFVGFFVAPILAFVILGKNEQWRDQRWGTAVVLTMVFGFCAVFGSGYLRAALQQQATECQLNLRDLSLAIEAYHSEHNAEPPTYLATLSPKYLVELPLCPSASQETYSGSYEKTETGYVLFCQGSHHASVNVPDNYPRLVWTVNEEGGTFELLSRP